MIFCFNFLQSFVLIFIFGVFVVTFSPSSEETETRKKRKLLPDVFRNGPIWGYFQNQISEKRDIKYDFASFFIFSENKKKKDLKIISKLGYSIT